jgi:hypothetical protein
MHADELVRQAGERLAARPVAIPSFQRVERAARRRRRGAVATMSVAAVTAIVVGVTLSVDGNPGSIASSAETAVPTTSPTTSLATEVPPSAAPDTSAAPDVSVEPHTPTTVAASVTVDPGSFADIEPDSAVVLPAAPIEGRVSPAAVWTGAEMIVWGGYVPLSPGGAEPLSDGAAFDPTTGTWRIIAAAPIEGRGDPASVWTGTEMLVWGGNASTATVADGAAYNPATDTWRTLAPAPIPDVARPATAWTGDEMLIVSGMRAVAGGGTPVSDAAAYNPVTDTWRTIASPIGTFTPPYPQATWTGDSLLMVTTETTTIPTDSSEPPQLRDIYRLVEYRPETDTWTVIDNTFDGTLVGVTGIGAAVSLPYGDLDGAILDPRGQVIGSVPARPATLRPAFSSQPIWTGIEVLIWGGNADGVALDPATQTWRNFPAGNVPNRVDGAIVWADGVMLGWGGFSSNRDGSTVAASDGIMYRPPNPGQPAPLPASEEFCATATAATEGRIDFNDPQQTDTLVNDPSISEIDRLQIQAQLQHAAANVASGAWSNDQLVNLVNRLCGINLPAATIAP